MTGMARDDSTRSGRPRTAIVTVDEAENWVRSACEARSVLRESRRQRKAAEDSIVPLNTEEFGLLNLEPLGFTDTCWWFVTLRDSDGWLIWFDGDDWFGAPENDVCHVDPTAGPVMFRNCESFVLHSLPEESV
tara:strand:- start:846 stop:1244 length:399 start_codon:yes stop_codon:yes gene_type:complete